MSFSEKQTANHQDTVLAIKKKYLNNQAKLNGQNLSRTPLADKNIPSKENYYQSPSRYLHSIGQSSIKTNNNDTSRVNQESMRDYMTLKAQYTMKSRNDNSINNLKGNSQNMFEKQLQSKQNKGIRRQFSKVNQVHNYRSEAESLASKWNKQKIIKSKELKQAHKYRANEALDLKQKNHKVIDEIQEMLMRIKSSLKEHNC